MEELRLYLIWQTPWLGIAAALVLGLLYALRAMHRSKSSFAAPVNRSLVATQATDRHRHFFPVAWLCAACALGSPILSREDSAPSASRVRDVALVVDISPSMALSDVAPTRLKRAQWKIEQLTQNAAATRFGLIAFSANAYVALPLTVDTAAITQFGNALDPQMVARKGSNLPRALELAARLLTESANHSRAIVVFSDGDVDPALALTPLQANIPIIAVGIGTTSGAPVMTSSGQTLLEGGQAVISRLNRDALRDLALASGGFYQDAATDDSDMRQVNAWLSELAARQAVVTPRKSDLALAPPLLAASAVLFMLAQFGLPRRVTRAGAIALALTAAEPAHAAPWSELLAWQALQQGDYARALDHYADVDGYEGRMGHGAAAYRLGEWQASLTAFQQAEAAAASNEQRARAAFNQGNAWAQLGDIDNAVAAYRSALRYAPGHSRAGINLNQLTLEKQARADSTGEANMPTSGESEPQTNDGRTDCAQPPCAAPIAKQSISGVVSPGTDTALTPNAPVATLLQRRFSRQDYLDGLSRIETRPW